MKKLFLCLISVAALQNGFCQRADSLENELKTAEGERKVKIMNELFRAYLNASPVKAIEYAREAIKLATEINDQKGMAAGYNNQGVAYKNQGALDMALENYLKSLEIYTTMNNGEGVATSKNNIAIIYSMKRDYDQALKYFEESRNGFVLLGDTERTIGTMNNLGNLYSDLKLYDQALKYYNSAWRLSDSTGHQFSDPLSNIGNLYYRQGNYQRAVEYYLRALEIVKKENNRLGELSILTSLGEVFTSASQPAEAQKYLEQASAMAGELQASFYMPQILKSMSKNYYKQGKLKEAYEAMVKYDEARESVYGDESTRKIAQMEVALQLKETERRIDELELDDKVKTLKLRNTQVIITAIILGVVIIAGLANLLMKNRNILTK